MSNGKPNVYDLAKEIAEKKLEWSLTKIENARRTGNPHSKRHVRSLIYNMNKWEMMAIVLQHYEGGEELLRDKKPVEDDRW